MKKTTLIKKSLASLSLVATALTGLPSASASGVDHSTIVDLTIDGAQYARVALKTAPTGARPACHNAYFTNHYAFDISTAKGKALFSALQAAQLSGKAVTIYGTTTCTDLGGGNVIETLATLALWTA